MSLLLDTDICSAYLRGHSGVFSRFVQHGGQLHISVVTRAELAVWTHRAVSTSSRYAQVHQLTLLVPSITIDEPVAEKFGEVRAQQLSAGQLTPPMDLLIAATALVHNLTLVTHNAKHYASVPGLRMVDWLAP